MPITKGKTSVFYFSEPISENISETPEGFLICKDVTLARCGPMEYKDDDDTIVLRGHVPQELSRPETIASFEGKPLTLEHPPEMLTAENVENFLIGHVTNVKYNDNENLLLCDIIIFAKKAIDFIKNGNKEVSAAYYADTEENDDGTYNLVNVVGNHVALTAAGRCGALCAIKDSNFKNEDVDVSCEKKKSLDSIFDSIKALFKEKALKDSDLENQDEGEPALAELLKRLEAVEAKLAEKKDTDAPVAPNKMDEILALLNKLLELEMKEKAALEAAQPTADMEDEDEDEGEESYDSKNIKIKVSDSIDALNASKAPTPQELNQKAQEFYKNQRRF